MTTSGQSARQGAKRILPGPSDKEWLLREELARHRAVRREVAGMLRDRASSRDAVADGLRRLDEIDARLTGLLDEKNKGDGARDAQIFQSQKLEAIGQLTGGIAHDFNNLLTIITAGLQLLERATGEERRERLIRRVEEAAWRGADLTRRLLAFARRQPLSPEALEVGPHLEGLRELLRHGLRDDIRIVTDISPGIWPIAADLAALELAILNLAVNARDAMPNGGTLVLGARNVPSDSLMRAELGLRAGDYVELFVSDTGTGMAPDVMARVFEPFFTTKPHGQGTGLGLAQVYGFAQQSGGTARAESPPGQGATVSLLLPRSAAAPPARTEDGNAQPNPAERVPAPAHLSVLVVEDDEAVAAVVVDMLDQLGHRGLRVSSLPAAVAVLSGSDCIDLIFSDVLLGNSGSGLDLAREVARRNLRIPMVLTSGYGGGVTARLAAARLPFLRKPYTLEALRCTLAQTLASAPDSQPSPACEGGTVRP